jgi:hypothetical protein
VPSSRVQYLWSNIPRERSGARSYASPLVGLRCTEYRGVSNTHSAARGRSLLLYLKVYQQSPGKDGCTAMTQREGRGQRGRALHCLTRCLSGSWLLSASLQQTCTWTYDRLMETCMSGCDCPPNFPRSPARVSAPVLCFGPCVHTEDSQDGGLSVRCDTVCVRLFSMSYTLTKPTTETSQLSHILVSMTRFASTSSNVSIDHGKSTLADRYVFVVHK